MLGGIELAAGSAKLSRYMATLGSPVKGLIENHDGKIVSLEHCLPDIPICSDYYSHSYEEWSIWSVDWVGGGPPCVWCSRAGKQEFNDHRSGMFCFGTAKRFSALVADVEQLWTQQFGTTSRPYASRMSSSRISACLVLRRMRTACTATSGTAESPEGHCVCESTFITKSTT
jgi:hypothetical protein